MSYAFDPTDFYKGLPSLPSMNPQLVNMAVPAGQDDAEYEAEQGQLTFDTQQKYNDVMKQLGYMSPTGAYVPGRVATDAARQSQDLDYQIQDADRQVTNTAQQQGTLFSGWRGDEQARQEHPMLTSLARLQTTTGLNLADLIEQANGLVQGFGHQQSLLLAAAAQRAAGRIQNRPSGADTGPDAPVGASIDLGPNAYAVDAALKNNPYLFSGGGPAAAVAKPQLLPGAGAIYGIQSAAQAAKPPKAIPVKAVKSPFIWNGHYG